jgi:hypothetical protein
MFTPSHTGWPAWRVFFLGPDFPKLGKDRYGLHANCCMLIAQLTLPPSLP